MPTRRRGQGAQLTLPFPESAPSRPPRPDRAGDLVALRGAVRLLLDVAEGRVMPSTGAREAVRRSLDVLAGHQPRGRLGHVVRRYRATPPTETDWTELVDELAFVLSLVPGGPLESAPNR
jgi:hypothetical protein